MYTYLCILFDFIVDYNFNICYHIDRSGDGGKKDEETGKRKAGNRRNGHGNDNFGDIQHSGSHHGTEKLDETGGA